MKKLAAALIFALVLGLGGAMAGPLVIDLAPVAENPASPQMGDSVVFHSILKNQGTAAANGVIAWFSLVQIDAGREQPVDLEDWSAERAVTAARLEPGKTLEADWPLRLIQSGHYRVVISATERDGTALATSPFVDFEVREKPVVESIRVLPVAIGLPILIGAFMVWRWPRRRRTD